MSQDLRIEHPDHTSFITTRTLHSKLWFHKNPKLHYLIKAFLAKYQQTYEVKIYFFVLMGNHYHLGADFPKMNRAHFMRDFNTIVAKLTGRHVEAHEGGPLWARRYRTQALVRNEDREKYFLYAALNPVSSGLVKKLHEYEEFGYNSVFDALSGKETMYHLIDWREYQDKVRSNPRLKPSDFRRTYTLTYSRLPGYEEYSQGEYKREFHKKIEVERKRLIEERRDKELGFAGVKALRAQKAGAAPRSTKTSGRYDKRPLILTTCAETRREFLDFYFSVRSAFTECYVALKNGVKDIVFPSGTYHPPLGWVQT